MNFSESLIARNYLGITNPPIEFRQNIYIPRVVRSITLERILNEYKKGTLNKVIRESPS